MTSWEYNWFGADVIYIAKYYEVRKESVDVISYRHPITGEIATYDSDQVEDIEDELAINDLSVGRYDVTVDVGPSYTARRDATVSVLTNVLSSMLPTDPMRPAIQGIILDNIDGEGLDDFKEYNRNQLLISGIAKPRNEKEQQIVQQAQMAAQSQPNPEMVLAQAQMVAAQAEAQKATNETAQTQIKAFTAQQDAMESQANTVYKLAQARNIDDKAVMEAIRLLKDVAESQQQQFQSPPQSPADLMPS